VFSAAYPLAQVELSDPDMPVEARIEAFNPLIPGDAERSGLPVAVLRFVLTNKTGRRMEAAVCGNLRNIIGWDGERGEAKANVNEWRQTGAIRGMYLSSRGVDPASEQYGDMALVTTAERGVTWRASWLGERWGMGLLDFWDDFGADGAVEDRERPETEQPQASLAVKFAIPARGRRSVTFLLAWRFPNRMTWTPPKAEGGGCCPAPERVGNWYATRYASAWDVAEAVAAELPALEKKTVAFVSAVCGSDLPEVVKEAALFNLAALRSQTCFRTDDGFLFGWEGCSDKRGCCHGSCTHVWNYEHATPFLFGLLARGMREVEFLHATDDRGLMSFRVSLPLSRAREWGVAAADGQMGCVMKLYREWRLSGDEGFLRRLWPQARKALEFCWIEGGWDADRDGVMEGAQHNTMDVEYYGPNPQMTGWYLGALRAAEEMARAVGEEGFAGQCRALFEKGSAWMDAHLFNGEYYEHEIRPPASPDAVAQGLRHPTMGARDLSDPDFQLGAGCLVDQLVGPLMARIMGLGRLIDRGHERATLRSVMKYNFRRGMWGHFNFMRTFAAGDESALLMATYPLGRRPRKPFPYTTEVMTGFEYTAGIHMLYEGMTAEGLRVIGAVRERHDGRKRNPFDEPECGRHYARSMASWGAVLALTGFQWDGVTGRMEFAAAKAKATWFWSNGEAWGVVEQKPGRDGVEVALKVLSGRLGLKRLALAGAGEVEVGRELAEGGSVRLRLKGGRRGR